MMAEINIPEPFEDTIDESIRSTVRIGNPFKEYVDEKWPNRLQSVSRKRQRSSTPPATPTCATAHTTDIPVDPSQAIDEEHVINPFVDIPPISINEIETSEFSSSNIFAEDYSAPLYPGATITTFQATTMLTSWFSLYPGISKSAFNRLLHVLHEYILPEGNNLPGTYDNAHKNLKRFLTPVKEYHCCVNDCVIYRDSTAGKYANLERCPVCKEPRYKDSNSKIPQKRFHHLPLQLRLRRLFGHEVTSQLLQQHQESVPSNSASSIHNSTAWKEWYAPEGIFQGDKQAVPLGICLDGVNPFSKENVSYSMWPILLFPLNLPDQIRKSSGSMMLAGIIPGPNEPREFDPYLDIIVDDILSLNNVEMYDAHNKSAFKLKTNILLHIFDYQGHNKVFHCQGAGAYSGCAYCVQKGEYCKALSKMVYLEHRAFLPAGDPLRFDVQHFPRKGLCFSLSPSAKTQEFVDRANGQYLAVKTQVARTALTQSTGCKGSNSLRRLPHHDRHVNTPVDPMHLIKNIAEHVVKLITGVEDSIKVRTEEHTRGRFVSSRPIVNDPTKKTKKIALPPAPFRLSKSDKIIANKRALCIRTPHSFDWTPKEIFSEKVHLKSVQWKYVLASGVLKYCLRNLLGTFQRKTLFELCDVLSLLLSEEIDYSEFDVVERRVHRVLSLLERDFPVSLHVIVFHLLHHLPMFIRRFGPAYGFWMYPFERFNSWIGRRVQNRRYPEATVIETYRLFEVTHFISMTKQLPQGSTLDFWDVLADDDDQVKSHTSQSTVLSVNDFAHLRDFYIPSNQSSLDNDTVLGLENSIDQCNFITKRDSHGRVIRYSSDDPNSKHSSCIIYTKQATISKEVVFGKIVKTYQHTFDGQVNSLLYVCWYGRFERDKESNLIVVHESHSFLNPFISVKNVSVPLVHAFDHEEHKVFILNCPPSIK